MSLVCPNCSSDQINRVVLDVRRRILGFQLTGPRLVVLVGCSCQECDLQWVSNLVDDGIQIPPASPCSPQAA